MVVRSKNLITKLNHAGFVKTRGGVGKSVCFSDFFSYFSGSCHVYLFVYVSFVRILFCVSCSLCVCLCARFTRDMA